MTGGVGHAEFHCFNLQMRALRTVNRDACHVEMAEDAQSHQAYDALCVGWYFMHPVAAIVHVNRADPVILVRGQIGFAHHTAIGLGVIGNRLGELAVIEGLGVGFGNHSQGASLLGVAE